MFAEALIESFVERLPNVYSEFSAEGLQRRRLVFQRLICLVLQKGRCRQRHLPFERRVEPVQRLLDSTDQPVAEAGIENRQAQADRRGDEFEAGRVLQLVQLFPTLRGIAIGDDIAGHHQRHGQANKSEQQTGANQQPRHSRLISGVDVCSTQQPEIEDLLRPQCAAHRP
jgi:hypothetical protein